MSTSSNAYNFELKQGGGHKFNVFKKGPKPLEQPIILTGYTTKLQARKDPIATAALTLTVGDGLTITALEGKIAVVISDTKSAAMAVGIYGQDLRLTPPGDDDEYILEGKIIVLPRYTQ